MKQKFNVITSSCIPLPLENVDTDQIIPARFLKAIDKEGMGDNLFRFNYDFRGKDLFEFNGREDGSSKFAKGNRYAFFPSGAVGTQRNGSPPSLHRDHHRHRS